MNVGVLALQGGVEEHMDALRAGAAKLKMQLSIRSVRTAEQLDGLDALVIPGGESTTLSKLLVKGEMIEKIRAIPCLFGTCAGLILMAKGVQGAEEDQQFIGVMDVKVSRNAYGSQADSFEAKLDAGEIGKINAVFIRAPKILSTGAGIDTLASINGEPVLIVQKNGGNFYLGCAFHPELSGSKVHEYFLKEIGRMKN